ncbi:MAG: 2'-5' RNA ligase family protein [Burkholderiaceae bacterium]
MPAQLPLFLDVPPPGPARPALQPVPLEPWALPWPEAPDGGGAALLHSLFFALAPAPDDARRLRADGLALDARFAIGGTPLESHRLHVSLFGVGAYLRTRPQADVERWRGAAASVGCGAFEVVFDRIATFGGAGRSLVLKAADESALAGLQALYESLGIALANAGEHVTQRRITPHMTLSYHGRPLSETAIAPVRWRAQELVLIDSYVGLHHHEVLGRWRLQDG